MRQNKQQQNQTQRKFKRILIVCEDKCSSAYYFKSFNSPSKGAGPKVEVIGGKGQTVGVVMAAEKHARAAKNRFDHVYCVFDHDGKADFGTAISNANKKGFIPIWSNMAFEIWYCLHAEYSTRYLTTKELENSVNALLSGSYDKADPAIRHNIENAPFELPQRAKISNIVFAIANAKRLEAYWEEMGSPSYDKRNPGTTVHVLVQELLTLFGI